jgi:hypothetical protein
LVVTASPSGIVTAETFGNPVANIAGGPLTAVPVGIASAQTFGTTAALLTLTATPTGISTGETFGTPTKLAGLTALANAIASLETWGTPSATKTLSAIPTGIPSLETWGTPNVPSIGGTTITLKHYESGVWVSREATPKIRLSDEWVVNMPKRWNAGTSSWVDIP